MSNENLTSLPALSMALMNSPVPPAGSMISNPSQYLEAIETQRSATSGRV